VFGVRDTTAIGDDHEVLETHIYAELLGTRGFGWGVLTDERDPVAAGSVLGDGG